MDKQTTFTDSLEIKKQTKFLNFFWLGFLIYSTGEIIDSSEYLSGKVCQAIQAIGLIFLVASAVNLIQFKIVNGYLRVLFTIYFFWLLLVIVRGLGFPPDYNFVKTFLFSGQMVYFSPLILLFHRNSIFYKKTFQAIIIFGIAYLLFSLIFVNKLLSSGRDLDSQRIVETISEMAIPAGFILLTYLYHSGKRHLLAVAIIIVTLVFTLIRARRGLIFITSMVIISSYFLYLYTTNKKILVIYLSILLVALGWLYASNIYNVKDYKIFEYLADRGNEDTRTGVELYFYDDMEPIDWIIGRGISGEYYCPDVQEDQVSNFRSGIETGYLQIILKGGLISLGLLLLIAVPAILKGIFASKNILSKAGGIWILLFIFNLYPQDAVSFSLGYFLVWISIGICYSDQMRRMSDRDINNKFFNLNEQ